MVVRLSARIWTQVVPGNTAYVIMYGEGCHNTTSQTRRTVDLFGKYKGRVQFVVIDLD